MSSIRKKTEPQPDLVLVRDDDSTKEINSNSSLDKNFYSWSDTAVSHRTKIAREILETERSYVHALYLLVKNFIIPLRNLVDTPEQVIKTQFIDEIFVNLEEIYKVNNELLTELENRILEEHWNERTTLIGQVFVTMVKQKKKKRISLFLKMTCKKKSLQSYKFIKLILKIINKVL